MQTLGKSASMTEQESKEQALQEYRKKLLQHKEIDAKVRTLREQVKQSKKEYDKTEDDLKALQSVGQIIAEVLRQLDEERCKSLLHASAVPGTACSTLKQKEQELYEQSRIASINHYTVAPCANGCK